MRKTGEFQSNIAADLKARGLSNNDGSSIKTSFRNSAITEVSEDGNITIKYNNEEIGEGRPVNDEGGCDHQFLVPNRARVRCVLPQVSEYFYL